MKKQMKILITIIFSIMISILHADEFEIISFVNAPNDVSAVRYSRSDINDSQCAIIKVLTDLKNLEFSANMGIAGNVEHKPGEYWVYVSPGEKQIKIMSEGFIPIDYNIPNRIESSKVYVLQMTKKGGPEAVDEGLIKVTFRINEENVYIAKDGAAPVMSSSKMAVFKVPVGEYTFTFSKEGYSDYEVKLNVKEEKILNISLVAGTTVTTLKLPGILTFTSDPIGAEIYLNDQKVGVTPYQGQLIAGHYQLMVKKNLYHSHTGTFTLNEGETKELSTITLKPKFGFIEISSNPSSADIFLDNKPLGKTPITKIKIESGEHNIRSQYELYHTENQNIIINDGDSKKINFQLKPAFGELDITSEPSGAKIFIDGVEVGRTPFLNKQFPSGTYDILITENLWTDATETVIVRDSEKTEKILVLTKNFGLVKINAPGSDIYMNGRKIGTGAHQANLKPGKYTFRATKDRHKDVEKEIFVVIGKTTEIELKPIPIQGSVSILSDPANTKGAYIFINGRKFEKTSPAVVPLLIGDYQITLKKQNFLDLTKKITVKENANQTLKFQMQTYQGSLTQEYNKYKTMKFVWMGATIVSAGVGTYFYLASNKKYEEYKTATDNATELHEQVELYDTIYPIAFGVSIACLVPTIIYAVKQKKVKKKVNLALVPTDDGVLATVVVNF